MSRAIKLAMVGATLSALISAPAAHAAFFSLPRGLKAQVENLDAAATSPGFALFQLRLEGIGLVSADLCSLATQTALATP